MTADVNVTEKVAKRLFASPVSNQAARTAPAIMALCDEAARDALSVLADPAVLAVIAGVLDEHDMGRLTSGRPYCWTHHTHDPLHLAAAVVERLRGRA